MNVSYQASLVNRHIRRFTGNKDGIIPLPFAFAEDSLSVLYRAEFALWHNV